MILSEIILGLDPIGEWTVDLKEYGISPIMQIIIKHIFTL